jgi:streptomycin 6-kinase
LLNGGSAKSIPQKPGGRRRSGHALKIPAGLAWLKASEAGAQWLSSLPDRVNGCVEKWNLRLGSPFATAYTSLTIPARLPNGADVVLKVPFPDRESEHEALALSWWGGDGAVRLLQNDPALGAFLIERCIPGTPLSSLDQDAALDVLVNLLPRLWKPVADAGFRPLADEASWWASHLRENWVGAGRPFDERLVDAALEALRSLPGSQAEQVLVHQDLHGDNVLRARREPWLAIDPKPLAGEREFSLAPIVRSFELGAGRRDVRHRLDRLSSELGLDRERSRLWCLAQTIAWSIGSEYLSTHIDTATWLLEM